MEETGSLFSIKVEKWHYNCGRHKFIKILMFKGGVLEAIKLGDYGRGKSDCLGAERRKNLREADPDTNKPPTSSSSSDIIYGQIIVLGRPFGAKVFLDGTYKGDIPLTLEYVKAGAHDIMVKNDKYKDRIEKALVTSGETLYLTIYLAPEW